MIYQLTGLRRTPCVGICSTTYGDLVCRGCKRFAHEIVQWNGFSEQQRSTVSQRLADLREGAVFSYLEIVDAESLRRQALERQLPATTLASLAYETLKWAASNRCHGDGDLSSLGMRALRGNPKPVAVLQAIEREFYERSVARYEHDFHTIAQ